MPAPPTPRHGVPLPAPVSHNQILTAAGLNQAGLRHLRPVLMQLEQSELLYLPRDRNCHAYFPVTAALSMHYTLEDGATVEVASIGNEGVLGAPPYTDCLPQTRSVFVSQAGTAYCIQADALRGLAAGPLRSALERNAQTLASQLMLNAACCGHHTVEQRMAKWLLLSMHRSGARQVPITQEALAHNLGVRRESVSLAVKRMEQCGTITHVRSNLTVHSPARLAQQACECYRTMRAWLESQAADLAALRRSAESGGAAPLLHARQMRDRRRPLSRVPQEGRRQADLPPLPPDAAHPRPGGREN